MLYHRATAAVTQQVVEKMYNKNGELTKRHDTTIAIFNCLMALSKKVFICHSPRVLVTIIFKAKSNVYEPDRSQHG